MVGYGECWGKTSLYKECGNTTRFQSVKAKKFMKDAEKDKQEGMHGQWQRESPAKEYLEQVKSSADTDCTNKMMKFNYFALRGGDREKSESIFKVEIRATEWAFERIREAFEKVPKMMRED